MKATGSAGLREFQGSAVSAFHTRSYELQQHVFGTRENPAHHPFRHWIPPQHEDFYNKLPFAVLATADEKENLWVSVATADPSKGRLMQATSTGIVFSGLDQLASFGDPALARLTSGQPIGMLGIELHTRRRNRVNGLVKLATDGTISLIPPLISFGNCPQYITERNWTFRKDSTRPRASSALSDKLSPSNQALISSSTTMFIGTGHHETGLEASHRGGPRGFVRVVDARTLMFPDFPGNHQLKSLGNVAANGKMGIWFGDMVSGEVVQLTGHAQVALVDTKQGRQTVDALLARAVSPETEHFPHTFHWVVVTVDAVVTRQNALSIVWEPRQDFVDLQVAAVVQESSDTKSFYLTPAEATVSLAAPVPGQYLPLFVSPPSHAYSRRRNLSVLDRTYTISGYGTQLESLPQASLPSSSSTSGAAAPSSSSSSSSPSFPSSPFSSSSSSSSTSSTSSSSASAPSSKRPPASSAWYRLTVKRDPRGEVSTWLHDCVKVGNMLQSREPQGHFVLQSVPNAQRQLRTPKSVVFLSAGIGLTPMVPLLQHATAVHAASSVAILWLHSNRSVTSLPRTLHREALALLDAHTEDTGARTTAHVRFTSQDSVQDDAKTVHVGHSAVVTSSGRWVASDLRKLLHRHGAEPETTHVYVCGPPSFMAMAAEALRDFPHMFAESFGPSSA